jgi:alpha-tubulin suppressor-like RCC1 family protein
VLALEHHLVTRLTSLLCSAGLMVVLIRRRRCAACEGSTKPEQA